MKNLDITKDRLNLANTFTKETNGQGWLQVNIKGLNLTNVDRVSINLGEVNFLNYKLGVEAKQAD